MSKSATRHLFDALKDVKLGDVLQVDLFIGIAGGVGGLVLSLTKPDRLLAGVSVTAGLVGVILGAVLAGVAVQVAFLDQPFLRKLALLERNPAHYLTPFLFTATIGVFAMLGMIILGAMSPSNPRWFIAAIGTATAFLSCWTVASLLPGLGTLVQFVGLKADAVDADETSAGPGGMPGGVTPIGTSSDGHLRAAKQK